MRPGVRIVWPQRRKRTDRREVEHIPPERDVMVVWRDRFGTIHATGWGPSVDTSSKRFERAVRAVLVELRLNRIIELNADERGVERE